MSGFEWASPWALLLLIPVALLPFQARLTGRNRLAVGQLTGVKRGTTLRLLLAWVPGVLRFFGLILLVLAMARPRLTHHEVVRESDGLDILLAIDTSGSMQDTDMVMDLMAVDRLTAAKSVVAKFVEGRPNDRIGIVVFGEEAITLVPLTLDHRTLLGALEGIQIGVVGSRGTAIGAAIAVSAKRLKELEAPSKIVILLTDGRNTVQDIPPLEAASAAGALDIKVYTVGVGASRRVRFNPFGDGLDEEGLTKIAEVTDAKFFRADSTQALQEVYAAIDELEPSPAQVRQLVNHVELYRRFAVPGIALLVMQVLLSATWLRRGP